MKLTLSVWAELLTILLSIKSRGIMFGFVILLASDIRFRISLLVEYYSSLNSYMNVLVFLRLFILLKL